MWFPKNSTPLLSSLDQLDVHTSTSVQTRNFSTLYASIPQNLSKSTADINGSGDKVCTADDICKMMEHTFN